MSDSRDAYNTELRTRGLATVRSQLANAEYPPRDAVRIVLDDPNSSKVHLDLKFDITDDTHERGEVSIMSVLEPEKARQLGTMLLEASIIAEDNRKEAEA